ncbi:MAG: polyphosphate kinase [Myxococcota bacterium]|jgi:polyphosphate kinase
MSELPIDLADPSLYTNRDLSHLEFNRRVMALAQDESVPLVERLRFLTILSSNLDEFFEVRVGGLQQRQLLELPLNTPDDLSPELALREISGVAHQMIDEQYQTLNGILLPALAAEDIHLLRRSVWTPEQSVWIRDYFHQQTLPVLSPVALDPAHPFPPVQNKGLNFIISLEGRDAFGRESGIAVLQVPRCLPRLLLLPEDISGPHSFVMISSVIHANVGALFPGMKVTGCFQFRITRNSDMWVDEEEIDDLLNALKGELHGRNYGRAVRLEAAVNCPPGLVALLLEHHQLDPRDLYSVQGPVNLHRLGALCNMALRPDLKFQPFTPGLPKSLDINEPIFSQLSQRPVLLLHPYQSFSPVIDLLWSAANDSDVLAIKMTLYRVGADSPIIDALIAAAQVGKEVTVVVELRARFDEARNITLATRLSEAGASVVYGVVGYKCHAKMILIVRREGTGLRRYVHVGTGNYHAGNARLYTDYSYMTTDPDVCEDVHEIFLQLTRMGQLIPLKRLLQSPFTLRQTLIEHIDAEAAASKAGKPARIIARMNSMTDHSVIQALYRASRAGVQIDLIIRGICCLKPGIPGVSENIRVRSILGRLLEHARVYYFYSGGNEKIYCASADWMYRNLHRRVEVACPIDDPFLRARITEEMLDWGLQDNTQAWLLDASNHYTRDTPAEGEVLFSSQEALIARLADHGRRGTSRSEDPEETLSKKRKNKSKGKRS